MNRIPEITCPVCRRTFTDHSETGVCPDCWKVVCMECGILPPGDRDFGHINDFRRYSFLCGVLRMFSAEYGFRYNVVRNGSVIGIRIRTGTGSEFMSLDMEDSEASKSEKMSLIIRWIVNFSQ